MGELFFNASEIESIDKQTPSGRKWDFSWPMGLSYEILKG
jgi:hypothetical protein